MESTENFDDFESFPDDHTDVISYEEASGEKESLNSHEAWILTFLMRSDWNGVKPIALRMFLAADLYANYVAFAPEHRTWSEHATRCNLGALLHRFIPNVVKKNIGVKHRPVYILPEDALKTTLAALNRTVKEVEFELWGF